ncbi:tetratricopeptide repeat protein, partial [candidate division GN15 bacterium]|nr:tetratricopeptide repeat protein [candidate division GN15 bacterium]
MTTTPSTKPWLAVIPLAVALIVRGIYLYFYQSLPDWEMLTVDNYFHHHWAQVIAGGDLLGDTTYFRAPLYVWCLAGLYALFGDGLWVGRLFGLVIGLSSVGMTYAIGRRLFTPSAGLIAAVIHAVYPIAVYFESELLLDPLYTLLLQLAVFASLGWWQQKGWWRFLLAGGLFGLAAICRPTALVFAIILAVVPIVLFGARRGLPRLGLYVLGLVLIIAPVTIRNISIAGDPVLIASQGGINFYIGNNEEADGVSAVLPEPLGHNWRIEDVVYIAERDLGRSLTPGEVSGYWLGAGFEWILENPGEAAVLYARKLYHHISNTEISNNRNLHDGFSPLSLFDYFPLGFGIIFGLAVAGVIARWPLDSRVRWLTILLLAAILAGSLFFFTSRFRLPLLPYFFVFAAVGLQGLIASWRNAKGQVYSSTIVAVAAALVSYLPIVSLPAGTGVQSALVRGSHYYTAGDYQAALAWYQQAQDLDPTFPEVHLNLGAAWLRLGQADSAMHYFREEIATHPERAKAYANLGSVLLLED